MRLNTLFKKVSLNKKYSIDEQQCRIKPKRNENPIYYSNSLITINNFDVQTCKCLNMFHQDSRFMSVYSKC